MDMQEAFLRDIAAHHDEDAPRLVYADWLEEQGDPQSLARAAYLRLNVELRRVHRYDERRRELAARLKGLRASLAADWLALLADSQLENCLEFVFRCPKRWDRLEWTGEPFVRHCTECRKKVYYCRTIGEAQAHAEEGHCVAVDLAVPRTPGDLQPQRETLGILFAPEPSPRGGGKEDTPPTRRRPR